MEQVVFLMLSTENLFLFSNCEENYSWLVSIFLQNSTFLPPNSINLFNKSIFFGPNSTKLFIRLYGHSWRREWQPTPIFLPGESQGQRSLVGCRLWGRTELDMTEATQQQQQQAIPFCAKCYQLTDIPHNISLSPV